MRTRSGMSMKSTAWSAAAFAVGALVVFAPAAFAQHSDNYEAPAYAASPLGVDLNGQPGVNPFYNPVPASSVSAKVYTYASNILQIPQNPKGGDQFVGATGPAGNRFARSQRDVPYPAGIVDVCVDILAKFTGALPAAQNIGSLSTQTFAAPSPSDQTFIMLSRWVDPNTAAAWNADYVWFDAAGTLLTESVADPAFQNLQVNHWYRWCTQFDLTTNAITQVRITDLTTNVTATHNPVGKYMFGGTLGTATGPPDGFRFFAGSSTVAGNTLGFDNMRIIPEPATALLLAFGGLALIRRRR